MSGSPLAHRCLVREAHGHYIRTTSLALPPPAGRAAVTLGPLCPGSLPIHASLPLSLCPSKLPSAAPS